MIHFPDNNLFHTPFHNTPLPICQVFLLLEYLYIA
ncbi:hypothetical protein Rhom172_1584 [Rhodothermus marinus SG0.5JP17-172]|nr:hypothetical protein Rhom172_1584 [Rhodothermus marinus SG0.5JP17-172]